VTLEKTAGIGWSTGSSQRLCIFETGSATGGRFMAAFSTPAVSEPAAFLMIARALPSPEAQAILNTDPWVQDSRKMEV
jgi:hypothetical protein